MRTVDPLDLPPVDLICGGFPCQDLSVANARAGARTGLSGPRSGLWAHMARVIEGQEPTWVVVENVARGWAKWLPHVRGDLQRLGYASIPVPLEARTVGREHVRSRLFVLAHSDGFKLREHKQRLPGGRPNSLRDGRNPEPMDAGRARGGVSESRPALVAHGLPRGLGKPYWSAVGNAVVPQCAEVIGHMIAELIGAGALARNPTNHPSPKG